MKVSTALVALAFSGSVLLSGCSSEAGPSVKPQASDPGPEALLTKLDALSADQCLISPADQIPSGCEKYITQLASTSGTIHAQIAKLPSTPARHSAALTSQADALDKGIAEFRGQNCTTVSAVGPPCTPVLISLSDTVKALKAELTP